MNLIMTFVIGPGSDYPDTDRVRSEMEQLGMKFEVVHPGTARAWMLWGEVALAHKLLNRSVEHPLVISRDAVEAKLAHVGFKPSNKWLKSIADIIEGKRPYEEGAPTCELCGDLMSKTGEFTWCCNSASDHPNRTAGLSAEESVEELADAGSAPFEMT